MTIADPAQTRPGSYTAYDNCAGFIVEGTFDGAGAYFPLRADERLNYVGLDITADSLRFRRQSDGAEFTLQGQVRYDKVPLISSVLSDSPGYETTFNATIRDAQGVELFTLDNFRLSTDFLSSSSKDVRFEGRIAHRTLGHVDLATVSPLRYQAPSFTPSAGKFEMQGDAALAKVAFTSGTPSTVLESIANFGSALDPTFGTGGVVRASFTGTSSGISGLASYNDGRLVAVGSSSASGSATAFVKRWNLDGSVDATFDPSWLETQFASGVAVTADEKIVIATTETGGFKLARANADGSPDLTFGTNGVVTTPFSYTWRNYFSLNLLPSGQVLVMTTLSNSTSRREYILARYDSSGALDPTFGTTGIVRFEAAAEWGLRVLVQPDGRILIASSVLLPSDGEATLQLIRLDTDGALDPAFGVGGLVQTKFDDAHTVFRDMRLLPDGRFIVAADVTSGYLQFNATLVRFLPNGTMDATFADAGYARHALDMYSSGVAVQSDGKILLGGRTEYGLYGALIALRFTSDGGLDPTFGVNGKARTPVANLSEGASTVLLSQTGKWIVGGSAAADIVLVQHLP